VRKNFGHEAPAADRTVYTVRLDGLTGLPTDRETATDALLHLLGQGYEFPRVALLRRDSPSSAWELAEVEPWPSRLRYVNRPIPNTVGRSR
jgi:hypothetical protein